ncbi:uncharacterized protein LOC114373778 [Glycine soja]|uniref:Uncharacterized protein n=1 Tax=Glycine soja TaxID=3848 RepID=A0A0B2RR48_GLYSO|nr:uncharacterized protein LOC114373778 [Glycine soja]KHN34262.1 hypothetical protein glysoja_037216 [Glycine soja]RZB80870.1 hypothetical protein D0Y65_030554 [Glycine soja]
MAFIARVCLLFLLLTSAVTCKEQPLMRDLNSNHNIDEHYYPGANPKYDPHISRPPRLGNRKMQISEEDYPAPGPNPIHYPFSPHPPPLDD